MNYSKNHKNNLPLKQRFYMFLNQIKGVIYQIVGYIATFGRINSQNNKKALIIRVDEIGDYILWRKCIDTILKAEKLEDYEVHFAGNQSWQSLFDIEYKETFNKLFWLDKNKFKKSIFYRFTFLRKIAKEHYSIVINPTYSRAIRVDDSIVKAAKATTNYGHVRNNENYLPYEQSFDNNLYHHLYEVKNKSSFEFTKNKEFTEWFCEKPIQKLKIDFDEAVLPSYKIENIPNKYFIIFPGSRSSARIWSTENFIEVSNYIFEKYQLTALVCGGNGDIVYAEKFKKAYSNPCIDVTGKTSLPELLSIIKNADYLLSVDTGSIHLAASVGCLTLGIFNGSQYGRFSPYPKDISTNIISFYPKVVKEDINKNGITEKYVLINNTSYNDVSAKELIDYLELNPIKDINI